LLAISLNGRPTRYQDDDGGPAAAGPLPSEDGWLAPYRLLAPLRADVPFWVLTEPRPTGSEDVRGRHELVFVYRAADDTSIELYRALCASQGSGAFVVDACEAARAALCGRWPMTYSRVRGN
jgi:hypothetical protein